MSCKQNESILIAALLQTASNEPAVIWDRREDILSGGLLVIEEINKDLNCSLVNLVVVGMGSITKYNNPYSAKLLQVIANLHGRIDLKI